MAETIDAAQKLITDRLRSIEEEASRLRRALDALGPAERSRSPRSEPRRSKAPGNRRRRSSPKRGERGEQLLAAIGASPGSRPADLAREMGIGPSQVHALLRRARDEGKIVKNGSGYELK